MAASKGPRYAPEDPTLPKPWRALVDGNTGYLYFWNPATNVTQYQKPSSETPISQSTSDNHPKPEVVSEHDAKQPQIDDHHHHISHPFRSEVSHQDDSAEVGQESCNVHAAGNGAQMSKEPAQGIRPSGMGSCSSAEEYRHQHEITVKTVNDDSAEVGQESCNVHAAGNGAQMSKEPAQGIRPSGMGSCSSAEEYRRQHEITVKTVNGDAPLPFTTFQSTGFPSEILREVLRAGFSAPTPIQAQSWPIALQNRDIVAVAKTGSGKTLGYLIPGFIHLKHLSNNSKMGPRVLILSPTRELATQIHDEAEKFGRSSRISSVCLYGGVPKGPQLRDLARGVDVVIATPGRLNDILEMKRVSLHQVSYMVLDEADRMLDMGFEPQIRKIMNEVPPRRQTLMFTATWPKEVRKIAADLLANPVQVNIGNIDELVANKSITQYVEVIMPMEKQRRLEQILQTQEPGSRIIVFCSTKRMCDRLAGTLTRQFGAAAIHGDKSQSERDSILAQFRSGTSPILVATDVAARGLDVKDIRAVINYDFPTGVEDYVHRIGRTGRAGATGVAYTFFGDKDSKYASDLVKILEGANQQVPTELLSMVSRGGYGGRSCRWSSNNSTSDEQGISRYGRDGCGSQSYSGRQDTSSGGYGGYKSTYASKDNEGPVWSHDRMMAAAAAGGSINFGSRSNSGQGGSRSRSRSPVGSNRDQGWN